MNGAKTATCPKCGAPIPSGGEGKGVCPRCVLEFAFQADSVEQTGSHARIPLLEDPPLQGQFGPYRIVSQLGKGGMAVVYLAEQVSLARRVALKVLPSRMARDIEFTERFQREARALATLSHPNIVAVFDSGCIEGRYYYAMELVEGTSLRQLLNTKKLLPSRAIEIVPQLCDALQYAHEKGVVHRDVKPENILVDRAGRVKIADFGLAKVLTDEAARSSALTGTMEILGTPHYIAPEQLERPKDVDHRADIYALGVVIYEMLTGELPIGKFDPPSWKAPVDARWDAIVMKAMEAEPERRFKDIAAMKEETTRATARRVATAAPSPKTPVPFRGAPSAVTRILGSLAQTAIASRSVNLALLYVVAAVAAVAIGVFVGKSTSKPPETASVQPPPAATSVAQAPPAVEDPKSPVADGSAAETAASTPHETAQPGGGTSPSPEVTVVAKKEPTSAGAADPPKMDPNPNEAASPPNKVADPPKKDPVPPAKDDLTPLGEDFTDKASVMKWTRLMDVERVASDGAGFQGLDRDGWLSLRPHTCTWCNDYRGPLLFKPVDGDFVFTVRVIVKGGSGQAVPAQSWSTAGILARAPRKVTRETWRPGEENWFYSGLGKTDQPGLHYEQKVTIASRSNKCDDHVAKGHASLRVARIGDQFFALGKDQGGEWQVLLLPPLPNLPKTLQVGLAVMTDYEGIYKRLPMEVNWSPIPDHNPDLLAKFSHPRFRRPPLPNDYAKHNMKEPWKEREFILSFLGDSLGDE